MSNEPLFNHRAVTGAPGKNRKQQAALHYTNNHASQSGHAKVRG